MKGGWVTVLHRIERRKISIDRPQLAFGQHFPSSNVAKRCGEEMIMSGLSKSVQVDRIQFLWMAILLLILHEEGSGNPKLMILLSSWERGVWGPSFLAHEPAFQIVVGQACAVYYSKRHMKIQ